MIYSLYCFFIFLSIGVKMDLFYGGGDRVKGSLVRGFWFLGGGVGWFCFVLWEKRELFWFILYYFC